MDLKKLLQDDDAVSPVIGVILMVAITVILAAVIASFVLGLGNDVGDGSPTASIGFEYTNESATGTADVIEVTHDGGDTIDSGKINASVRDAYGQVNGAGYKELTFGEASTASTHSDGDLFNSGDVKSGASDTVTTKDLYDADNPGTDVTDVDLSTVTVNVVWNSADGETSTTLNSFEGPDA